MPRPNILLITSDQQHWNAMGSTNPDVSTPMLDKLAAEGIRCTRAYCNNPTCTPARASMLTGMYPSWHHAYSLGTKLPEDTPTVNDALHTAGYHTSLIGKAHFQQLKNVPFNESVECPEKMRDLEYWRAHRGPWYGFDRIELSRMHGDEAWVGQHYALWLEEKGLQDWADYFRPLPWETEKWEARRKAEGTSDDRYFISQNRSWNLPQAYHHNCWIAERTIEIMQQNVDEGRPFFAWASFFDPHPPYVIPEPWASMYTPEQMTVPGTMQRDFSKMPPHFQKTQEENPDFVTNYEEEGGSGLHGCHSHLYPEEELKKDIACYYGMMSFMDQQIGRIVDAVDAMGQRENTLVIFTTDHGHFFGQHGLIAKGPFHYEDMIKIPWITRMPGTVQEGVVSEAMQEQVDIPVTMLSLAGIDVPGLMQGVDQTEVYTGKAENARTHILCENRHNPTTMDLRTYVDKRYKLTVYRSQPYGELFDLETDPDELTNLWDDPASQTLKGELMHKFMQAEMQRAPTRMPRVSGA